MSDPIPGFAKRLHRVFYENDASVTPWDVLPSETRNRWVQVASAACIMALGSDHLPNALQQLRTQLAASEEKLRVAREALRDFVDECRSGVSMGKSWKEYQIFDDTVEQGRAALKAIGEGKS